MGALKSLLKLSGLACLFGQHSWTKQHSVRRCSCCNAFETCDGVKWVRLPDEWGRP